VLNIYIYILSIKMCDKIKTTDNQFIFSNNNDQNVIAIEKCDNLMWIISANIDDRSVETKQKYLKMIHSSFSHMKNVGCEKLLQNVTMSDWQNLLSKNKEWKIKNINTHENIVSVECDINVAHELVIDGMLRN